MYHLIGIDAEKKLMAPGNRPIEIVREASIARSCWPRTCDEGVSPLIGA